jgi:hypothetical protein
MAENKTRATYASVKAYLAAIKDPGRRSDCEGLANLMGNLTKQPPKMWGPGIVGFGTYHYKYDSGREGDFFLLGFASRKGDISVYGLISFPGFEELMAKLGKHKMGKGCLYIRKMSDIAPKVLEQLLRKSLDERKRRFP